MSYKRLIVLSVCLIALVVVIIAIFNAKNVNTGAINTQTTSNDVGDTLEHDIKQEDNIDDEKYLFLNCLDTTIFSDQVLNIDKFVSYYPVDQWTISVKSDNLSVVYDSQNKTIYSKDGELNADVTISVEPNFDNKNTLYFSDRSFPIQQTFNLTVLPSSVTLEASVKSRSINNFEISVYSLKTDLNIENFNINSEDISYSSIYESDGKIILNNVKLINALQNDIIFSYSLTNSCNETRNFNHQIQLAQDASFLSYDFVLGMPQTLYITKNDIYDADFPNKIEVIVTQNFDMDIQENFEKLVLLEGDQTGVNINNLTLVAKKEGKYIVGLILCGAIVCTYSFNACNVPILYASSQQENYICDIDKSVCIAPLEDSIIPKDIAIYNVRYLIVGAQDEVAFVDQCGNFISNCYGEYEVKISVGDFVYSVYIVVKQTTNDVVTFKILDVNGKVLEKCTVNLSELYSYGSNNLFLSIEVQLSSKIYNHFAAQISCDNVNFVAATLLPNALQIIVKKDVNVNDKFVLKICLPQTQTYDEQNVTVEIIVT